jgi:uncharacterized protein
MNIDKSLPEIISPELIAYIKNSYHLNWHGVHGWDHWLRVYENGMYIAERNGANQQVVALFAFTHDMARDNEGWDTKHGPRAALRIKTELQGKFFHLSQNELGLLMEAVEQHTNGLMQAHLTVQTCWDSDRLDLGRVGYRPDPKRLCTLEAKQPETIEWAFRRSRM